ncbi:hypothetical protein HaLaN_31063, partial [Haematococcus lacustris]
MRSKQANRLLIAAMVTCASWHEQNRAKLAEAGRRKLEEFRKVKALSKAPPAKTSETSGNALASGNLPASNAGVLAPPTEVPGQLALNATPFAQKAVEPSPAEAHTPTAAAG